MIIEEVLLVLMAIKELGHSTHDLPKASSIDIGSNSIHEMTVIFCWS